MDAREKLRRDPTLLLQRFIYLRKNGVNRDDAWFQVLNEVGGISEQVQADLLKLAKVFERREGHQYRYPAQRDDHATLSRREVQQRQTPQQAQQIDLARQRYRASNNGMTGSLNPGNLREGRAQQLEQVLDQIDATPIPKGSTAPIKQLADPEHFGPEMMLLMYFAGVRKPLPVVVEGEAELYIGRGTDNVAMSPEIDLNAVNGADYGVSRMHAVITRRDNKLLIADLGSVNHTRVNGVRLMQNEILRLKDGDELWFGQLRCKLRFKHR